MSFHDFFRWPVLFRLSASGVIVFFVFHSPGLFASEPVLSTASVSRPVVFLHFNDFYDIEGRHGKGGLFLLYKAIEEQRKHHPNAIVTFGGDLLSPSLYSSTTKGQHMIDALALLHVDVAVIGNHEFDFGFDNALTQFKASDFSWLGSNLQYSFNGIDNNLHPFYIHRLNGFKIGFMGLITPDLASLANVKAGQTSDPESELVVKEVISSARQTVDKLKNHDVDFIVALTHMTLEEDTELALAVKDVDLILGGHDHYPVSQWINNTLIVKSGFNGEFLSVVRLEHQEDAQKPLSIMSWETLSTSPLKTSALNISAMTLPESGAIQDNETAHSLLDQYLQHYQQQLRQKYSEPLITLTVPLDARTEVVRSRESSFADWVADALRHHYETDIALINGGGIRSDHVFDAGSTLTEKDILTALPFANRTGVVQLNGKQLLSILEHGVSAVQQYSGRFPQVSGLSFELYPELPPGQRIAQVKIAGQPLEPEKSYTLASSDFLLRGGDGYLQLQQAPRQLEPEEGELLSNIVSSYFKTMSADQSIKMERIRIMKPSQNNREVR